MIRPDRQNLETEFRVVGQFRFTQGWNSSCPLWEDGPMTIGKGKRPRDANQLAKWIVEQSTAGEPAAGPIETPTPVPPPAPVDLSAYMSAIGRRGGMVGGKRRLATMTAAARKKAAKKAAQARWGKRGKNA
jgi:hypothetical protein